jgi:penicillin-binding protein 2
MNSLASQGNQSWLSWFLRGTLIFLFLILAAKLFEVQIIKGAFYRGLSEENRIRHIPIPAPRGKILARNGEELATNVQIKKRIKYSPSGNYELTDDLTGASVDEIVTDYKRVYPLSDKFAHASGYLAKAGDSEVGKINPDCPEVGPIVLGSLVGRTGLEQEYQCLLMGSPGEELIEVDTRGAKVRSLGRREPVPGQDIKITIDYNLQIEVATDVQDNVSPVKKGAAIVTTPDGEILAFYSGPSFDPNKLTPDLFQNPDLPLFDRVISGTFHPGSVFKPVVAMSALQEGAIDKNFQFTDAGVITVNGFSYSNWYFSEYGRTEGQIDLVRAIARSTDTFFYKVGEMTGPVNLAKWADTFGLDKKTGVDLPGETKGLIPTPDWKKSQIKESWFLGDTYHMAIGQGFVSVTPIELNTYIAAVAGGKLCKPHFFGDTNCEQLNVKKENLDLVKEGMKAACTSGGTAYTFFDFAKTHGETQVACKTGTAEVGTDGEPHAWFTFIAPAEKPEIVTTILIERGGQGSQIAGPIARKIADFYFQGLKQ